MIDHAFPCEVPYCHLFSIDDKSIVLAVVYNT